MDTTFESFPSDEVSSDPEAYKKASKIKKKIKN